MAIGLTPAQAGSGTETNPRPRSGHKTVAPWRKPGDDWGYTLCRPLRGLNAKSPRRRALLGIARRTTSRIPEGWAENSPGQVPWTQPWELVKFQSPQICHAAPDCGCGGSARAQRLLQCITASPARRGGSWHGRPRCHSTPRESTGRSRRPSAVWPAPRTLS